MGLKRVAIVGLAPSTHNLAPWDDMGWEIWGLPWDEGYWPHMDRLFEMHDMRLLESEHSRRPKGYLQRLQELDVPLYMQAIYFGAIKYPFEEVKESIGIGYWNSSIAYAMALAIHERYDEISIYGVDMADNEEYSYQRPNMEFLIGVAVGRGIKVNIPEQSNLCKFHGTGIKFCNYLPVYKERYGWLGE